MCLPFNNILIDKIFAVFLCDCPRAVNALHILRNSFIERRFTRSRQREHVWYFMPRVIFPRSLIDEENLSLKDQQRKDEAKYQKQTQSVKKYQPVRSEIFS